MKCSIPTLFILAILFVFSCEKNESTSLNVLGNYSGLFAIESQGAHIDFEDTEARVTGTNDQIHISIDYLKSLGDPLEFEATLDEGNNYNVSDFTSELGTFSGTVTFPSNGQIKAELTGSSGEASYVGDN